MSNQAHKSIKKVKQLPLYLAKQYHGKHLQKINPLNIGRRK